MTISLGSLSESLSAIPICEATVSGRSRASVAMVLAEQEGKARVLFIERARDERDPWSGNLAFPGGRVEPGESLHQAAERETQEEIGLDLSHARPVGRLADIVGTNLPIQVSCFAYALCAPQPDLRLNHEVQAAFWVDLSDLADPSRHITTDVRFSVNRLNVPAIRLPDREWPVLWGITYRLVMQVLEVLPGTRQHLHFPPEDVHLLKTLHTQEDIP